MFLQCFYADYYGEWTLNEYCSDLEFNNLYDAIIQIYNLMEGITLKDLPEEYQRSLEKQKGAQFGIVYDKAS